MITQQIGEHTLALYLATCSTASCENRGVPVAIWGDLNAPEIGCGACGAVGIEHEPAETEEP